MRNRPAFTFIEMVMVIVLLGIVLAIGFVSINSYQTHHQRTAAERIANDLRMARNLALSSAKWHGVIFSTINNNYSVYSTDGTTDTLLKKTYDPGQDYIVNIASDYQNVVISSVSIGGVGVKVEFDPYGVPWTDKNGSQLGSNGIITLTAGDGSTSNILIEPNTGRISVQ